MKKAHANCDERQSTIRNDAGFETFWGLLVALCLFMSMTTAIHAQAIDHPGGLFSTDPTPIKFSYGPYHLRMPRNYIVGMANKSGGVQNDIVTLQVAFPGAKPYSNETKNCFLRPWLYSPSKCLLIEFYLELYPIYVDDQTFFNLRPVFNNQSPKHGPFGFDEYDEGPDNARIENYIKVTPKYTFVTTCFVENPKGKRSGFCEASTRTSSGIFPTYRFDLKYLGHLEEIDIGLRQLFDSFSISKDGK